MTADLHAAALAAVAARRALIEAGTAGPWFVPSHDDEYMGPADVVGPGKPGQRYIVCEHAGSDAPLIAQMGTDYSRWIDALEQVLVRHYPLTGGSKATSGYAGYCCHGEEYERLPMLWTDCPDARSVLAALGLEA